MNAVNVPGVGLVVCCKCPCHADDTDDHKHCACSGDTLTVDVPCDERGWGDGDWSGGCSRCDNTGTVSRTVRVVEVLPIVTHHQGRGKRYFRISSTGRVWFVDEHERQKLVILPDAKPGGVALIVEVVE
jgi:hypothetical protein